MTRFKKIAFGCCAALISLTYAAPAMCQTVPPTVGAPASAGSYSFGVTADSIFADAIITTDASGHATNIVGLVNGTDPITGLSNYAGADNNLYATGAWVTFGGLSFSTTSLGDFNFYNSGMGHYGFLSSATNAQGYADSRVATAHLSAVPEPASWAMMLVGFGATGFAMRRIRSKKVYLPQLV